MGVKNLFSFVDKSLREGSITELRGKTVALDVSCFLHRGIFGEIAKNGESGGSDFPFYIVYVKKYVKFLLDQNCHVVLVFDGRPLPAKIATNAARREKRAENRRTAELLRAEGKEREANDMLKRATEITPEVVQRCIEYFRRMEGVDTIVSPYESDAQLAYLLKAKIVDAVVTEDSDLIVFGCQKIFFKWNLETGMCTVYERIFISKCFSGRFDFVKFRWACILAGCDYLPNGMANVGLKKAFDAFARFDSRDLKTVLPKIPKQPKMPAGAKVTPEFMKAFIEADQTFLYQIVFDPRLRIQRPLTEYPPDFDDLEQMDDLFGVDDIYDDGTSSDPPIRAPVSVSRFPCAGQISAPTLSLQLALGNKDGGLMNVKFVLPQNLSKKSIYHDTYVAQGVMAEQTRVAKAKAAKQCGAFVLTSPSKRRVKKIDDASSAKRKRFLDSDEDDEEENDDDDEIIAIEASTSALVAKRQKISAVERSVSLTSKTKGSNVVAAAVERSKSVFAAVRKSPIKKKLASDQSRKLRNEPSDPSVMGMDEIMELYKDDINEKSATPVLDPGPPDDEDIFLFDDDVVVAEEIVVAQVEEVAATSSTAASAATLDNSPSAGGVGKRKKIALVNRTIVLSDEEAIVGLDGEDDDNAATPVAARGTGRDGYGRKTNKAQTSIQPIEKSISEPLPKAKTPKKTQPESAAAASLFTPASTVLKEKNETREMDSDETPATATTSSSSLTTPAAAVQRSKSLGGKSAYFSSMNRSTCSNPFKRPLLTPSAVATPPIVKSKSMTSPRKRGEMKDIKTSLFDARNDGDGAEDGDATPTAGGGRVNPYKFGFKAAGLRRSTSTK